MKQTDSNIINQFANPEAFKVPEGYFDQFSSQFEVQHLSTRSVLWTKMRALVYAAAVVAIVVLSGFGFVMLQDHIEKKNMEYLSSKTYIQTQIEELSEDDLVEAILADNN